MGLLALNTLLRLILLPITLDQLSLQSVGIAIFTFIDPEAATYLNEQILLVTKQTMERFGMPQEAMQAALMKLLKKTTFH